MFWKLKLLLINFYFLIFHAGLYSLFYINSICSSTLPIPSIFRSYMYISFSLSCMNIMNLMNRAKKIKWRNISSTVLFEHLRKLLITFSPNIENDKTNCLLFMNVIYMIYEWEFVYSIPQSFSLDLFIIIYLNIFVIVIICCMGIMEYMFRDREIFNT